MMKNFTYFFILLGLSVFSTGTFVKAQETLLFDNFESYPLNRTPETWTRVFGGDSDNALVIEDSGSKVLSSVGGIHLTGETYTDFVLEVKIKPSTVAANSWCGIVGRATDDKNWYVLWVNGGNTLGLGRNVNGTTASLGTAAITYEANKWYTLKLRFEGTSIKAYFEGEEKMSKTDDKLASGKVGLRSSAAELADNVLVTSLHTDPKPGDYTISFLQNPANPDQYQGVIIDKLREIGYKVDVSYTPFDFQALEASDLIIIGRTTISGEFTSIDSWSALKTPVMVLNPHVGQNDRMKLINKNKIFNSTDFDPTLGANDITIAKPVENTGGGYDPVFEGVSGNGANFDLYKGIYQVAPITIANFAAENNGKALVKLASGPASNYVSVIRWSPGVETYAGSGHTPQGYRTLLPIGTAKGTDLNFVNLMSASQKLFLNEVAFLIEKGATTGIKDLAREALNVSVYPNPSVGGNFTIRFKDVRGTNASVKIYNIAGSQVYNRMVEVNGDTRVNAGLKKGIYIMKLDARGKQSGHKLVVQ